VGDQITPNIMAPDVFGCAMVLADWWVCRSWRGSVCGQGSSSYVVAVGREEGFRLRRSQCYPGDAPVPAPLSGRWEETERMRVGAPPRAAPRPARARPVLTTVLAASRPEPAHNRACGPQTQLLQQHVSSSGQQHAELVAQKSLQLVRSICNSCSFRGRDAHYCAPPHRSVRARFRHTAPTSGA